MAVERSWAKPSTRPENLPPPSSGCWRRRSRPWRSRPTTPSQPRAAAAAPAAAARGCEGVVGRERHGLDLLRQQPLDGGGKFSGRVEGFAHDLSTAMERRLAEKV